MQSIDRINIMYQNNIKHRLPYGGKQNMTDTRPDWREVTVGEAALMAAIAGHLIFWKMSLVQDQAEVADTSADMLTIAGEQWHVVMLPGFFALLERTEVPGQISYMLTRTVASDETMYRPTLTIEVGEADDPSWHKTAQRRVDA